ncbi:MAG: WG repeat-containing protein [Cloacibacterium sp.]|nr:WG repeat-containing protein [Cloacibacterium sp.]
MKFLIQLLCISISFASFAQEKEDWLAFYNQDSTKIGFKDTKGNVKIEARFQPFMTQQVFRNVIAVQETVSDGKTECYYLNKNGKKFGKDSLYVFDFEYASEKEEKIKFRDPKTDKVGFFDIQGKVVIPAEYNDTTDFNTGIAIGIKGAEKKRWHKDSQHQNCDHWSWVGGKTVAINAKNQVLFEVPSTKDLSYTIDYSKFEINKKVDNEIYTSYQASDGNTYSFYSPERDFKKWFENQFLPDFRKNKKILPVYYFDLISVSDNDDPQYPTVWKNHHKKEFISRHAKRIDAYFTHFLEKKLSLSYFASTLTNALYYAENIRPKEDLSKNICISFHFSKGNFENQYHFEFTKIGEQFYLTSVPE